MLWYGNHRTDHDVPRPRTHSQRPARRRLLLEPGTGLGPLPPLLYVPLAVVLVLWAFVLSFFRDPERAIPPEADALVSPADGTVTFAGAVADPDFPGGRAFAISIFLSVFNVHVNRVPRSGRVLRLQYFPGCFRDARHGDCG